MILKSLAGLSLVMSVAFDQDVPPTPVLADPGGYMQMSIRQRDAALLPLVRRATDCVVGKVTADSRYEADMTPAGINDLIVDSIAVCAKPVRAMIDAHDRMYGKGSGEAFLLGPYLDVLPSAVVKQVKVKAPR